MKANRKHVAGIAVAAVAAAYSLLRLRDDSHDADEQVPTAEQRNPTAD